MSKKKSIGEKIAEKVDHVLHPDQSIESADQPAEEIEVSDDKPEAKPLSQDSQAMSTHRKFDKFKKGT
jgi:hypothetical protein